MAWDNRTASTCTKHVQVTGNFMFDAATHRDFLGAILGTGIDRRTIGDILLQGEQGAQVLCMPDMVEHLESSLIQVCLHQSHSFLLRFLFL